MMPSKSSSLILFALALLSAGCDRQQALPQEHGRIIWQYHIETIESGAHEDRPKITAQATKMNDAEWFRKIKEADQRPGTFYPDESKLNELGKAGWEMVSSYIEPETVWPNIALTEVDPMQRQPNIRGARLVMV
ncbi:MAG: hypothetical protein JWQ04_3190, partial [Pedosphaera sp.]|nr:hypothetical protein [Pedosphaera sp.]